MLVPGEYFPHMTCYLTVVWGRVGRFRCSGRYFPCSQDMRRHEIRMDCVTILTQAHGMMLLFNLESPLHWKGRDHRFRPYCRCIRHLSSDFADCRLHVYDLLAYYIDEVHLSVQRRGTSSDE